MQAGPSNANSSFRPLPLVVIGLGALLMVGSVFADTIGISGGGQGFGWKQLIGAIVGLVIVLAGVAWLINPVPGASSNATRERNGGDQR